MLKEQNYEVLGITLQLYNSSLAQKKNNSCCAGVDIADAKAVAAKFDFPHYVLNYENLFKESVIDKFADSYLRGETPVPCIECNKSVKFHDLLKMARELGASALATGHYVQRIIGESGNPELHKAVDEKKDQSYFLFATTGEQLDFLRFPLGSMKKDEVRKTAENLGLKIANKPDSQDICFVPDGDYAKVIRQVRPTAFRAGEIIHIETKKILGVHDGIINFTLGQRRGLGIAYSNPLFVVKIDAEKNTVFVGEERFLQNKKFVIRDVNWIAPIESRIEGIFAKVKLRSNHKEEDAKIKILDDGKIEIEMKSTSRAITPGQACVMYQDTKIIGGGWITKNIE
jgi:tRNA-specific 2-thiouridylase